MRRELEHKVEQAVRLLRSIKADVTEVCYSGGKDSDVILELTRMAGIRYRAIYKNTTIDQPGTLAHVRERGAEVMQPRMTFLELIKDSGFPSRFVRKCCSVLKEYKVLDHAILGVRRAESTKRAALYHEPVRCRFYGSKKNRVEQILPILEWTNADVAEFLQERGVRCHPHYYDEQGRFHPERRLGCMGCPQRGDNGLAEFKKYPNLVKMWVRGGREFFRTKPHTKTAKMFGTAENLFFCRLFCKTYEEFCQMLQPDLFGNTLDAKKFLEDYFHIKL